MKPLNKKNYGSIGHFSASKLGLGDHHINIGQERILTLKTRDKNDYIYITEKFDGSNVGIAKVQGKIYALGRRGYEAKSSKFLMHHYFNDWVLANENLFKHLLNEGERLVGEWMLQAHSLRYEIATNKHPFIAFDWFDANNERYLQTDLRTLLEPYNIELPRIIYEGFSAYEINKALTILNDLTFKNNSIHCKDEKPEGLVYRIERKEKVDFLAKYVRSDFEAGKYLINDAPAIWNVDLGQFSKNLKIDMSR